MRPSRKKPRLLRRVLVALLIVSVIVVCSALYSISSVTLPSAGGEDAPTPVSRVECLRLVPPSTVSTWRERDFLVVVGIPSVDGDGWKRRRGLQRRTCWRYNGVATRLNNFSGEFLPLYLLAPHRSNGYEISDSLREEASQSHDVIILPTNDVCSSSRRRIGEGGSWGVESEVVMSRKTYLWFEFATGAFPSVSYIVKGDDDVYVRVPRYLASLRTLPRTGLYMGRLFHARFFWRSGYVPFCAGYFATLSRDVAEAFVSYKPLERLLKAPYSIFSIRQYLSLGVLHEDIMTGLVLREKVKYKDLITVDVKGCHFHNGKKKGTMAPLTEEYIVVHHVREEDYEAQMTHFPVDDPALAQPTNFVWLNDTFAVALCLTRPNIRRSFYRSLLSALRRFLPWKS